MKKAIASPGDDFVQNQSEIAQRFRTKSATAAPLFFIGSSPSLASRIISPDYPAAGVMISENSLNKRKSDFEYDGDWMFDSSAFTQIAIHGKFLQTVEERHSSICRWQRCGNLLIAVAQDWMCEEFVLNRTGLTVADHQRLTIERYDQQLALNPPVPIMPVLQGFRVSDYLKHLGDYGERLRMGQWVGVGSVCRRNGSPEAVADILRSIKLIRPDLKLHGFGLKVIALENPAIRELLHSTDSMAWSYPRRFQPEPEPEIKLAHKYQQRVQAAVDDSVQKRPPVTAGAGNGQGRKSEWNSVTGSIRLPRKYHARCKQNCKQWEAEEEL